MEYIPETWQERAELFLEYPYYATLWLAMLTKPAKLEVKKVKFGWVVLVDNREYEVSIHNPKGLVRIAKLDWRDFYFVRRRARKICDPWAVIRNAPGVF
jgi:hypothetical protein